MVDCKSPPTVTGVIIDPFNNTKFGALITFHCEENDDSTTAVCGTDGEWFPNPASLMCGESGSTPSDTGTGRCVDVLRIIIYYHICST